MRIVGRLLRILLVVVVVGAGASRGWSARSRSGPCRSTDGTIQVAGLGASVDGPPRRDRASSHINADTPHDLFLAQGYVHAQERMWQMEVWRHISSGRLSELFGASHARRRTGSSGRSAGARPPSATSPRSSDGPRAALDAYADGVNAWHRDAPRPPRARVRRDGPARGIGGVGGYDLEPWTALDTLAWQKVQAWQLGGNFDTRGLPDARRRAARRPGPDRRAVPAYARTDAGDHAVDRGLAPGRTPPTARRGAGPGGRRRAATAAAAGAAVAADSAGRDPRDRRPRRAATASLGDHQVGSNNWVVGPVEERRPAARSSPTTRTSASRCRRSGS